ncbi:unnamed protein product [Moneuplotes crassus]|uniref:Uncharacterized protein n=1 Tax=Euplotes crassus TaxID=5936 RepID=A0AAD1UHW0_EUPCR|nr:unnamed protein product [Moneuplotes crassus]
MGNCFGSNSGGVMDMAKGANNLAKAGEKSEAEKQFDALVQAIENSEKDDSFIYFKYTSLESVDKVVLDAQRIVNDIYKIRITLKKSMEKLIHKTHIWEINGANSSHAIVAMIYSIYAQTEREEAESLIVFKKKFPFVGKGKDSKVEGVATNMKILFDYTTAMETAGAKMPKLVEECIDLAKKAVSLGDSYMDELKQADQKVTIKAAKSVPHNLKMLKRTKLMALTTMKIIKKLTVELTLASKVLVEERNDLPDYGKTLADEGITEPLECYKKVGKPVEPVDPPTTEESLLDFPHIEEQIEEVPEELDGEQFEEAKGGNAVEVQEEAKLNSANNAQAHENQKESDEEEEDTKKEETDDKDTKKEDENEAEGEGEHEDIDKNNMEADKDTAKEGETKKEADDE